METNPLEAKATVARLRELAQQGDLTPPALERALVLLGAQPSATRWGQFISNGLLGLGAAFTIAGIFFFFAYNWAVLPRLVKFGVLEAGLLLAVGFAAARGLGKRSGQAALLAAAFLVGVLQAVYGQVYQVEADAYQLFLGWAGLIFGWVVISANAGLWFLWLVLLNLGLGAYGTQVLEPSAGLGLAVFALNASAWVIWEVARYRGVPWLGARWPIRLLACAAIIAIVGPTVAFISIDFLSRYAFDPDPWRLVAAGVYAIFIGLLLFSYSRWLNDLLLLTLGAASLVVVGTALVARLVTFQGLSFGLAEGVMVAGCIGSAVLGQVIVAFYLLRKVAEAKAGGQ